MRHLSDGGGGEGGGGRTGNWTVDNHLPLVSRTLLHYTESPCSPGWLPIFSSSASASGVWPVGLPWYLELQVRLPGLPHSLQLQHGPTPQLLSSCPLSSLPVPLCSSALTLCFGRMLAFLSNMVTISGSLAGFSFIGDIPGFSQSHSLLHQVSRSWHDRLLGVMGCGPVLRAELSSSGGAGSTLGY